MIPYTFEATRYTSIRPTAKAMFVSTTVPDFKVENNDLLSDEIFPKKVPNTGHLMLTQSIGIGPTTQLA